jgi:hypothetical protein
MQKIFNVLVGLDFFIFSMSSMGVKSTGAFFAERQAVVY